MTTSILDNLLPDWETDHGGITLGDIIVLVFDAILLIYTAWRSYDLLTGTVPSGMEVMAIVGLVGLDLGAILWSLVWIFGSATKYQDWVSMLFFLIDLVGVVLTSLTDSLMYGDADGVMYTILQPVAMIGIPIIIIGNVVAGFIYHMTSPATRARRARRKLQEKEAVLAERIQENQMLLRHAQNALLQRQREVQQGQVLAQIKIKLDALERGANEVLTSGAQVGAAMKDLGLSTDQSLTDFPSIEEQEKELAALQAELSALNADGSSSGLDEKEVPAWPFAVPQTALKQEAEKRIPKWIFFRTNSPKHLIRTNQLGEDVTLITGIPDTLKFAGSPPLVYVPDRADNDQPKSRLKNTVIPRYNPEGELISPFFYTDAQGEKQPITISDWKNTAVVPEGTDIWAEATSPTPAVNPTGAGAE